MRGIERRRPRRRDVGRAPRRLARVRAADLPRPVPHAATSRTTFARRFGDLEFEAVADLQHRRDGTVHSEPDDDVVKSLRGNEGWHHDSTYMPVQAKGAVFSAEIVPTGGAPPAGPTCAPPTTRSTTPTRDRVAGADAPTTRCTTARAAPGTCRRRRTTTGWLRPVRLPRQRAVAAPAGEGPPRHRPAEPAASAATPTASSAWTPTSPERFLDELNDWACQAPRTYHHQWEVGDAVIWDNRRLMHRATPFDMTEPRRMWHTRIAGEPSSELALNHR